MDQFTEGWGPGWPESYRLIQNQGTGLIIHGPRDWADVEVSASITPHMARSAGLAIRTQGLRRHYSLVLADDGSARIIKTMRGQTRALAEAPIEWRLYEARHVRLRAHGNRISAWIDSALLFDLTDEEEPLTSGGIGLLCEEGRVGVDDVDVRPAAAE